MLAQNPNKMWEFTDSNKAILTFTLQPQPTPQLQPTPAEVLVPLEAKGQEPWCSICNDFGSTLILCAECRVTACMETMGTGIGCVAWDDTAFDDNFMYICPYCAFRPKGGNYGMCDCPPSILTWFHLHQLCLTDTQHLPKKMHILYRYDPPVLIIALMWHEMQAGFVDTGGEGPLSQWVHCGYIVGSGAICPHYHWGQGLVYWVSKLQANCKQMEKKPQLPAQQFLIKFTIHWADLPAVCWVQ